MPSRVSNTGRGYIPTNKNSGNNQGPPRPAGTRLSSNVSTNPRLGNPSGLGVILGLWIIINFLVVLLGHAVGWVARGFIGFSRITVVRALWELCSRLGGYVPLNKLGGIQMASLPSWKDIWSRRRWVHYAFEIRVRGRRSPPQRNLELKGALELKCPLDSESRYHEEMDTLSQLCIKIHLAKLKLQDQYGPIVGQIEVQITRTWYLCDVYRVMSWAFTVAVEREGCAGAEIFVNERDLLADTPALICTPSYVSLGDRWTIIVRDCSRVSALMGGLLSYLLGFLFGSMIGV
ncbi:hypothetical protein FRC12_003888 [Ceratobasidium sp. 428]|nr:hypothetical protein FRC12_003888 [Ceratobasidium sp. 428]